MVQGLLLIAICLSRASAQVIDLGTEAEVTNTYLESGFITLSASDKITITTSSTFSFPIVFLSTVFSSSEYSDAIPLEARVEQLADNGGAAVFTVQLVWPSNKTCVSEWSDGSSPQGSYTVGWYVGETGGYSVSGVQMEFVTAPVNAQSWTKTTWPYTFGSACHYPAQSGDDSYSPGAIFSLQSNNNDLQYLTVRSSSWFQTDRTQCNYAWKAGDLRMYPHDSNTVDTSAIQEETVGVLLFDTRFPQTLDCLAGSYLEIGQVTTLTDQPFQFIMYQPVDTSSVSLGVFGAVLTLEGGDAMMIKSFSPTSSPTDAYAFIQVKRSVCLQSPSEVLMNMLVLIMILFL